jgi:hypothetical protein
MNKPSTLLFACLLATALFQCHGLAAQGAKGLLIYCDRPTDNAEFARATEYSTISAFSTVNNFMTPDGRQVSVETPLVLKTIDYGKFYPSAFRDILQDRDLVGIIDAINELKATTSRHPATRKFLQPFIAALESEKDNFRKGQGKFDGKWYASLKDAINAQKLPMLLAEAERKRQIDADKAEAERLEMANKARLAAAAEAEKARIAAAKDAEAAEKERVNLFVLSATKVLDQIVANKLWNESFDNLAKVSPVPDGLLTQSKELQAKWAELGPKIMNPEPLKTGDEISNVLKAVALYQDATTSILGMDAPLAHDRLQDFFDHEPKYFPPLYVAILTHLKTMSDSMNTRSKAAESHIHEAQRQIAERKTTKVLVEYQAAYSLYPNPEILQKLQELRKSSLGL